MPIDAFADLLHRRAVRRVEAAHEADQHPLRGMPRRGGFDAQAIGDVERQRLFAEHVLAGVERGDHLVGVQRRRRDDHHRIDLRQPQQRRRSRRRRRQRLAPIRRPRALVGHRARRGDDLGAADAPAKYLGMPASEPPQSRHRDAQRAFHACLPLSVMPRGRPGGARNLLLSHLFERALRARRVADAGSRLRSAAKRPFRHAQRHAIRRRPPLRHHLPRPPRGRFLRAADRRAPRGRRDASPSTSAARRRTPRSAARASASTRRWRRASATTRWAASSSRRSRAKAATSRT